jgi:hypothetical protein
MPAQSATSRRGPGGEGRDGPSQPARLPNGSLYTQRTRIRSAHREVPLMPKASEPATEIVDAIREGLPRGVELYEAVTPAIKGRQPAV